MFNAYARKANSPRHHGYVPYQGADNLQIAMVNRRDHPVHGHSDRRLLDAVRLAALPPDSGPESLTKPILTARVPRSRGGLRSKPARSPSRGRPDQALGGTGSAHRVAGACEDLAVQCAAVIPGRGRDSPYVPRTPLGCGCTLLAVQGVTRAQRTAPCTASTWGAESAKLPGWEMRDLRPDEAAAMLRVSPDTLRAWEERFGYPHSISRTTGQATPTER